jgi:hypothetical protein
MRAAAAGTLSALPFSHATHGIPFLRVGPRLTELSCIAAFKPAELADMNPRETDLVNAVLCTRRAPGPSPLQTLSRLWRRAFGGAGAAMDGGSMCSLACSRRMVDRIQ